jgi:hypothetical protein
MRPKKVIEAGLVLVPANNYFVAATVRNECPVRSSKCHFTRPHKCFVVVEDIAIRLPKHKHIDTNSTVHFNLFSRCHWLHMCTESVNQQHLFFKTLLRGES